jgi:hypothetical protein
LLFEHFILNIIVKFDSSPLESMKLQMVLEMEPKMNLKCTTDF